jgi:hypothetical protein
MIPFVLQYIKGTHYGSVIFVHQHVPAPKVLTDFDVDINGLL